MPRNNPHQALAATPGVRLNCGVRTKASEPHGGCAASASSSNIRVDPSTTSHVLAHVVAHVRLLTHTVTAVAVTAVVARRFCLLQYTSNPRSSYWQLLLHNAKYCRGHPRCRLHQEFREDTSVPGYWKKVFMVDMALRGVGEERCDLVMWLDRDAVISNHNENFSFFWHHDMHIGMEGSRINAGVFAVRNTERGRHIIADWVAVYNGPARARWSFNGSGFDRPGDSERPKWACTGCAWAGEEYEQGAFEKIVLPKHADAIFIDRDANWNNPTPLCGDSSIKHFLGARLKHGMMQQYACMCLQPPGQAQCTLDGLTNASRFHCHGCRSCVADPARKPPCIRLSLCGTCCRGCAAAAYYSKYYPVIGSPHTGGVWGTGG